jgi:hypothetical protein
VRAGGRIEGAAEATPSGGQRLTATVILSLVGEFEVSGRRCCATLAGMDERERLEQELAEAEAEFDTATKLSEIRRTAGRLHRARAALRGGLGQGAEATHPWPWLGRRFLVAGAFLFARRASTGLRASQRAIGLTKPRPRAPAATANNAHTAADSASRRCHREWRNR